MGFVRVICPFVIAATLLLLLPMVTVTSEAIKVGNTDISFVSTSFVSTSEPRYPRLLVKTPGVDEVLDRQTMDQEELFFNNVGLNKEHLAVIAFILVDDPKKRKVFIDKLSQKPLEVSFGSNDIPVLWTANGIFHINETLVRYTATLGEGKSAIYQLWSILYILPDIELIWENIKDHIIGILQARNRRNCACDDVKIAKKYRVVCGDPVKAEEDFMAMLKTDKILNEYLEHDDMTVQGQASGPATSPTRAQAEGAQAIAPSTSAPEQPLARNTRRGRGKGKGGRQR
eukprot:GHVS01080612.1.p1 GENE.GHVS01080612.1~~GHVS01080612.1.p1  ORF type:complete len:286 (+),score=8.91 GHVS01080612.1:159-1016(+)